MVTAILVEALDGPTPATHVALALRIHAQQETPFDSAWRSAIRSLPRADSPELLEWRSMLRWAKPYFRESYTQLVSAALTDRASADARAVAVA